MKSCLENDTTDLDSISERRGKLGIPRRNAAPALQAEKRIFYKMAQFIKVSIIIAWILAALSGRNDHLHPCCRRFFDHLAAVIAAVDRQTFRRYPFDQGASLRTISGGTLCDKESDRHTMRIHGQIYFCADLPFVRAISWFPPGAPLAYG